MNKKVSIIIVILLCLISCRQDLTKQNQELIIGDWTPILDYYILINRVGYQFTADNQCDNKIGFYNYFYPDGITLDYFSFVQNDSAWFCNPFNPDEYPSRFDEFLFNVNHTYGNKTTYTVEKDTLQIFDPAKQKWMKYHINFEGPDTLRLSYWNEDKKYEISDLYMRASYEHIDKKPLFEQFVFYSAPSCYSGPKYLLIRRDGLFFSYGYFETGRFFIAKMQPEEFERIETLFKQANIAEVLDSLHLSLHDRYGFGNRYESKLTFVTIDNKIITVKEPFRNEVPVEFFWGYLSGVFLPDVVQELKPCYSNDNECLDLLGELGDFFLTIGDFPLYSSEQFYLLALLCYANPTENNAFESKYALTDSWNKKDIMQTDGRYFRYTNKEGKEITLDIGFNFIEVNGLDQANQ